MITNTDLNRINLYAIIDNTPDPIWTFDTDFKLMAANKAFFQLRRSVYNQSINIGDDIFKHTNEKAREKWRPLYERVLAGETITMQETRVMGAAEMYVEITMNPVYDDSGALIGCMGVTRDISYRKVAEKKIAAYIKKMETLTFKTTHELRNPITNIMSLVTLSRIEGTSPAELIQYFDLVDVSARKLDDIVTDLIYLISKYNR
jgi:PAS domain S-box-containing protein